MSFFDIPEVSGRMTREQIRRYAIDAAVRGIEEYADGSETLGLGRLTDEDDEAIRADMRSIANDIGRGSICDLSI